MGGMQSGESIGGTTSVALAGGMKSQKEFTPKEMRIIAGCSDDLRKKVANGDVFQLPETDIHEITRKVEEILFRFRNEEIILVFLKMDEEHMGIDITSEGYDKGLLSDSDKVHLYNTAERLSNYSNELLIYLSKHIDSEVLLSLFYAYADNKNIYEIKNNVKSNDKCPRWIMELEISLKN